jgi:hypothetical protein
VVGAQAIYNDENHIVIRKFSLQALVADGIPLMNDKNKSNQKEQDTKQLLLEFEFSHSYQ